LPTQQSCKRCSAQLRFSRRPGPAIDRAVLSPIPKEASRSERLSLGDRFALRSIPT
jgi:hypothetical protein